MIVSDIVSDSQTCIEDEKGCRPLAEAAKRLHILTHCMVKPQSNIHVFSYASLSCFRTVAGALQMGGVHKERVCAPL